MIDVVNTVVCLFVKYKMDLYLTHALSLSFTLASSFDSASEQDNSQQTFFASPQRLTILQNWKTDYVK